MQTVPETIEASIFCRVFGNGRKSMPPELADYLVGLSFSGEDQARMHELAKRNEQGRLSDEELRELDGYILVGDVLALLQSQARKSLKSNSRRRSRHG
jgi:hypothetical protein